MNVQPLSSYHAPKYPTRPVLGQQPEPLKQLPSRWRGNPVVIAAFASLCALATANEKEPPKEKVAPLFVHGEGRGSFGCVVVNPPVFLNEAEARTIILEEAKKAGLSFTVAQNQYNELKVVLNAKGTGQTNSSVIVDGIDQKRKIAFVFVSQEDAEKADRLNTSTVSSYDLKRDAKALIGTMSKYQSETIVGTFYDPMIRSNWSWDKVRSDKNWKANRKKAQAQAKTTEREMLRKQVRDFVKWLKAQGVI